VHPAFDERRQAKQHQQPIHRHWPGLAIHIGDLHRHQASIPFVAPCYLTNLEQYSVHIAQGLNFRNGLRCSLQDITAMQQRDTLAVALGCEPYGLFQRRIIATDNEQVLARKIVGGIRVVEQLRVQKFLQTLNSEQLGLESTYTGCHDDDFGYELGAFRRFYKKPAIFTLFKRGDLLAQVKLRHKRRQLLEQVGHQFTPGVALHTGNVVNRFVRVKLDALPAWMGQRIDNLGGDFKQAKLK